MRTVRLAILGDSPCHDCFAACCRQNGHEYAALLQGDEVRKFRPFAVDAPIQADGHVVIEKVLPYRDGRCIFLGDDDRCTVYEDRPQACRAFQCTRFYNQDGIGRHGLFLQRNPRVRELLDRL